MKDETESSAASKRRKLKREHIPSSAMEAGEYSPVAPPPPPPLASSQSYDSRERGVDRKGAAIPRGGYMEEPVRIHGKETTSKIPRRDADMYPKKLFMFSHV